MWSKRTMKVPETCLLSKIYNILKIFHHIAKQETYFYDLFHLFSHFILNKIHEILYLRVQSLQNSSNFAIVQYLQRIISTKCWKSNVDAFIILRFWEKCDVSSSLKVVFHKKPFVFMYASNMLERVLRLVKISYASVSNRKTIHHVDRSGLLTKPDEVRSLAVKGSRLSISTR